MRRAQLLLMLLVVTAIAPACAPVDRKSDVFRVSNAELGIALASLPAPFEVLRNEGRALELAPTGNAAAGTLRVECAAREGGVNLVAEVQAHRQRIEAMTAGEYRGGQELVCPLGSAFWSRGRYSDGQATWEEACVFALHPDQVTLLSLCYVYPASNDSGSRVEQLLAVLGEVEAAAAPPT